MSKVKNVTVIETGDGVQTAKSNFFSTFKVYEVSLVSEDDNYIDPFFVIGVSMEDVAKMFEGHDIDSIHLVSDVLVTNRAKYEIRNEVMG